MNPFESLSAENHDQVQKYLRFFSQKKEGLLRTINIEFSDAKADKLNEDMYSKEDLEDFCDFLATAIKNNVGAELGTIIGMGALAVSQLLESAQERGVELVLETAAVENQALLQAVEKMGLQSLPKNPRRGVGELISFKDDAKATKDASNRIDDKNRQLQEEVFNLTKRLAQMERQLSFEKSENIASEGKRSDSSRQIYYHQETNSNPNSNPNPNPNHNHNHNLNPNLNPTQTLGKRSDSSDLQSSGDKEKIRKLENALSDSREENNKRVSDTSQFQQMKKIMQTQSSNIRDLRRRLERYEPDTAKEDDDDQF